MATGGGKAGLSREAVLSIIGGLKISLEGLIEQVPTKKMEANIKADLSRNTDYIQKLFNLRKEDRTDFRERALEVIGEINGYDTGGATPLSDDLLAKERKDFFTARRSLRL